MVQPATPDPFGAAFVGYVDAARHWRHWLGTVVAVLVPADVLAFLLPAVASAGDAAVVNGRLVPTDSALRWAAVTLTANGSRAVVPVVLLVGWAVALVLCLRVFAGVRRNIGSALALLGMGTVAAAALTVVALAIGGWAAFAVLGVGGTVLSAFTLALPAAVVDGLGVVDALRRASALVKGRMWTVGVALLLALAVLPGLLLLAAASIEDGLGGAGESWAWVAVRAGAGGLLGDLALLAVVPVQAAVLLRVFRSAGAGEPSDPSSARRAPGAIVAAALLACLVATGFVL